MTAIIIINYLSQRHLLQLILRPVHHLHQNRQWLATSPYQRQVVLINVYILHACMYMYVDVSDQ